MRGLLVSLLCLSLSSFGWGADLEVPGQYPTIQAALDAAVDGDRVLVSAGTYAERLATNLSIELIGVDGPELTILDARGAPGSGSALALQYHSGGAALVRGFTIHGDQATIFAFPFGGGAITSFGGYLTVEQCIIEDCDLRNTAGPSGGGILANAMMAVVLRDSIFRNNHCIGQGGAVYAASSEVVISGCLFEDNSSDLNSGAIYTHFPLITDCIFRNNSSGDDAGAVSIAGSGRIQNSIFERNSANGQGGALFVSDDLDVFQCVFYDNSSAGTGGAIRHFSHSMHIESSLILNNSAPSRGAVSTQTGFSSSNSIYWQNGPSPLWNTSLNNIQYCIVEGGFPGVGNFDADPLISDPVNSDYSLLYGSPATDAGSNVLLRRDLDDLNGNGLISDGYGHDMLGNPRHTQDLFVADTGELDMLTFPLDIGPIERIIPTPTDGYDDCNGNSINDLLDIMSETETDLNENLIPDSCDIADGTLTDADGDGVPDEYQNACVPDLNEDGELDFFDVSLYLQLFSMGCP